MVKTQELDSLGSSPGSHICNLCDTGQLTNLSETYFPHLYSKKIITPFGTLPVGLYTYWASLVAQLVKNLPAIQKTWFPFLGWEDLLEKEKATYSRILAWRIPWTIQSMGSQRVRHNRVTFTSTFFHWYFTTVNVVKIYMFLSKLRTYSSSCFVVSILSLVMFMSHL